MGMAATNNITKPNVLYRKKDSMKYVITMCLLFAVLIFGRAANNTLFYAFAGISLAVFAFSSVSHCFSFLLFLLPFSLILKTNVDGMSFFTILFFLVVLKMIINKKTIHGSVLISVMLFAAYCILFSGLGQITTIITMVSGMVMIYYLRNIDIDVNESIIAFFMGITGASVLALLKNQFPIINGFVSDLMFRLNEGEYAIRFAGLQGNPNYYTLDITILLAALIVMVYGKVAPRFYAIYLVVLSIFGLMSVSKSFLVCWVLLLIIWFLLSMRQGVGKVFKFLMIFLIGGAVVYYFAYDAISSYLFRFAEDSGGTLGDITTGRTDIWKVYIDEILNDFKILLFGNGLNTVGMRGKGTHNTFLESIFSLGIFGTTLFLISLKTCMGKIITKYIMWVPIIMLLFRMFAIGILTYDSIWLYFGLIVILSNQVKEKNVNEENVLCKKQKR